MKLWQVLQNEDDMAHELEKNESFGRLIGCCQVCQARFLPDYDERIGRCGNDNSKNEGSLAILASLVFMWMQVLDAASSCVIPTTFQSRCDMSTRATCFCRRPPVTMTAVSKIYLTN